MTDSKETILIGDVHGCVEELEELLRLIDFTPSNQRVIFLGDLGDRGPYSYEVVKLVRSLCEKGEAECVLGNHDQKHVRYRGHQIKQNLSGTPNPMKRMSPNDLEFHRKLSDEDIAWMRKLPLSIHLMDKWHAIHGGLEPAFTFDKQNPNQLIRCRYVDNKGRAVALNPDKSQPANSVYWTDAWDGPESIVYGHCVHSREKPLIEERYVTITPLPTYKVKCVGIDTGCVFGGSLTAYHLDDGDRYTQVKARRAYANLNIQLDE